MGKRLIWILGMVFLWGGIGTAFAANPFVDVPAKHWAYDAVSKLAQAGIVDGYGDGTFKGDKTMTRYEMAQIVAKSMAHADKATAEQKAIIDKLAVEFGAELNNLGVRVAALEKKAAADRVNFSGLYRLRYQHDTLSVPGRADVCDLNALYSLLQIDATAKINDEWTAGMEWQAYKNFRNDKGYPGSQSMAQGASGYGGQYDVNQAYVTGPILPGVRVTAGKYSDTLGSGIMYSGEGTGAKVEFGNALQVKLGAFQADAWTGANNPAATNFISQYGKVYIGQLNYNASKATALGASFQQWNRNATTAASATYKSPNNMNLWDFSFSSNLTKDWNFFANYLRTNADRENVGWNAGFNYKVADINKPGSYNLYLQYEDYQLTTTTPNNGFWQSPGERGWALGGGYVLATNVKFTFVGLYGKFRDVNDSGSGGSALPSGSSQKFFRTQIYYFF